MTPVQFGSYKVIKKIAAGGMGDVFEAHDPATNRTVAIKTLRQEFNDSPEFIGRFKREAKILSKILHHNTVIVYGTGEAEGILYIVMELVKGLTLKDYLLSRRFFFADLASIFMQIMDGLDAVHRSGILHRDIKLSNVMITENHLIKIGDFGVAKSIYEEQTTLTKTGQMLGTLHMLPPEILAGEEFTAQSDIYSLGLLFFEILTGFNPIFGKNNAETLMNINRMNMDFPKDLNAIIHWELRQAILRMVQKDPGKRPTSIAEAKTIVSKALERQSNFLPIKNIRYPANYPDPAHLIQIMADNNCNYLLSQAYVLEFSSGFGSKPFESIDEDSILAAMSRLKPTATTTNASKDIDEVPEVEAAEEEQKNTSGFQAYQAIQNIKRLHTDEILVEMPAEQKKAGTIGLKNIMDSPKLEMAAPPKKKRPRPAITEPQKPSGLLGSILGILKGPKK